MSADQCITHAQLLNLRTRKIRKQRLETIRCGQTGPERKQRERERRFLVAVLEDAKRTCRTTLSAAQKSQKTFISGYNRTGRVDARDVAQDKLSRKKTAHRPLIATLAIRGAGTRLARAKVQQTSVR